MDLQKLIEAFLAGKSNLVVEGDKTYYAVQLEENAEAPEGFEALNGVAVAEASEEALATLVEAGFDKSKFEKKDDSDEDDEKAKSKKLQEKADRLGITLEEAELLEAGIPGKDKDEDESDDDDTDEDDEKAKSKKSGKKDDVDVNESLESAAWKEKITQEIMSEIGEYGVKSKATAAKIYGEFCRTMKSHDMLKPPADNSKGRDAWEAGKNDLLGDTISAYLKKLGIKENAVEFDAKHADLDQIKEAVEAEGLKMVVEGEVAQVRFDEAEEQTVLKIFEGRLNSIDNHVVSGSGKSFYRLMREADFSEAAMDNLGIIYEAAVAERVSTIAEELEVEMDSKIEEQVTELVGALDEAVAEGIAEWRAANESDLVDGIRAARAERLVEGLKNLLEEVGLEIPESEVGDLRESQQSLNEASAELEALREANESLQAQVSRIGRDKDLNEAADALGLSFNQRIKLEDLAESIGDDENFSVKVRALAEAHFTSRRKSPRSQIVAESAGDVITEGVVHTEDKPLNPVNESLRRGSRVVRFS